MAQAYSEHRTRQKRRSGVARSTEGPDGGPEDSSKERNPAVVVDEASVDGAGADGVMGTPPWADDPQPETQCII